MKEEPKEKLDVLKVFDERYRKEEHVWGVEPSAGVMEALPFLKPGNVLDLGAGDGRNALYLAHLGFTITAVDISSTAIDRLMTYAARAKVEERIQGIVSDIEAYKPEGQFENIVSTFTLEFLSADSFLHVVTRIMEMTTSGGVNVIEDFTRNGPMYDRFAQSIRSYWLESGELRGIYEERGWTILHYAEVPTQARATDEEGNRLVQEAARLVASKPSQD